METKFYILCLATLVLVLTSCIYGVKFLRKGNYLLGVEWLIVTFSGSNFLIFGLTGAQAAYDISYFCDAFSRAFGIPVITVAGLMAVTHNYRPTKLADIGFFAASVAGTIVLMSSSLVTALKPYFYVAMWTGFSVYLAYFAARLLLVDETFHATAVTLVLLMAQAIASIYDFYKIPGDDQQFIFYILAGLTWSLVCIEMYYAYCALERGKKNERVLTTNKEITT